MIINYQQLNIIFTSVYNNEDFFRKEITKYIDVTYYNDWLKYCNSFTTLFIDIDGTLVLNSGEYSKKMGVKLKV